MGWCGGVGGGGEMGWCGGVGGGGVMEWCGGVGGVEVTGIRSDDSGFLAAGSPADIDAGVRGGLGVDLRAEGVADGREEGARPRNDDCLGLAETALGGGCSGIDGLRVCAAARPALAVVGVSGDGALFGVPGAGALIGFSSGTSSWRFAVNLPPVRVGLRRCAPSFGLTLRHVAKSATAAAMCICFTPPPYAYPPRRERVRAIAERARS